MGIQFSVMERRNPADPTAPKKFYGVARSTGEIDLRSLSKQISAMSTVSVIDTTAVLESLLQVVPEHLLAGKIVRLGEFGSYRLTLSTGGAETQQDFNKALIKKVRLKFRPGSIIRTLLKTADYDRAA